MWSVRNRKTARKVETGRKFQELTLRILSAEAPKQRTLETEAKQLQQFEP